MGSGNAALGGRAAFSEWNPRNARNLDLEAERAGQVGGFSRSMYSLHDDRREPPSPKKREESPGGKWGHDLFESVVKAELDPKSRRRDDDENEEKEEGDENDRRDERK